MDALEEAVISSPFLPQYVDSFKRVLEDEQRRRLRFYEEVTEDVKWEFINGEVVMHSPAKVRHIEASDALFSLLRAYVVVKQLGQVMHEKAMVSLTRNDYEPDICFFRGEVADSFAPDQMQLPAPDFIVEVLSPSTSHNDRGIKKRDYAAHGVKEYWIVDPGAQNIEQFVLAGTEFVLSGVRNGNEEIAATAVPGFSIPVRAIFQREASVAALKTLLTIP